MNPETKVRKESKIKREILLAFALTVFLISGLTHASKILPFLSQHIQWIAALAFLFIPHFFLKRRGKSLEDVGVIRQKWAAYMLPALRMSLIVFPLFIVGFHGVQTLIFDRTFQPTELSVWEEEEGLVSALINGPKPIDKRPKNLGSRPFQMWEERESLHLVWNTPSKAHLTGTLESDGTLEVLKSLQVKDGALYTKATKTQNFNTIGPHKLTFSSKMPEGLQIQILDGTQFTLTLALDGKPLSGNGIGLGEFNLSSDATGTWAFSRSILWLFALFLMHVLMVGVPEEAFYRGYVQSSLQEHNKDSWNFLGTPWGWSVVWTSILFGMGHFLIELDPSRLIVFFPSLLFGWMKNREGTIGSVAVFHGLCNVLLDVISRFYV